MTPACQDLEAVLLNIDDTLLDTRTAMMGAASRLIARLWPEAAARERARLAVSR